MKQQFRLVNATVRQNAMQAVSDAPEGMIVAISEPTRSSIANAKLWAMLADISKAMPMGRRHTPDDWKAIMMSACGWEVQFIEGLDGRPFPQGFRSSRLTMKQMSDLISYMYAFGADHNVRWSETV